MSKHNILGFIWLIFALLFGKKRFGKELLSKHPTFKMLFYNSINHILFRTGSTKAFFPSVVVIEPTVLCNLRCPHCPRTVEGSPRATPSMTADFFHHFLSFNHSYITHLNFGMFGEPLMNRDLPEMVSAASRWGIKSRIHTNGILLDEDLVSRLGEAGITTISFSIDSLHEEYEEIRRIKFGDILGRLRVALERKNQYGYFIEVVSIADIRKFSRKAYQDFFRQFSPDIDFVWFQPHYQSNKNKDIPFRKPCYRLWHILNVYTDGLVSFCAFDNKRDFIVGDAGKESLKQIFNNRTMQTIRKDFRDGKIPEICRKCDPYYR